MDIAKRRGRVLMVGHVFLFNAGIIKLRELCQLAKLETHNTLPQRGPISGQFVAMSTSPTTWLHMILQSLTGFSKASQRLFQRRGNHFFSLEWKMSSLSQ